MERRLALTLIFLLFAQNCFVQEVSFERQIRMRLWAELDAYPGLFPDEMPDEEAEADAGGSANGEKSAGENARAARYDKAVYAHAFSQLGKITPFLINGMVYGWSFDYTPYDKARGVGEYFSFEEIRPFDKEQRQIRYEDPIFGENRIYCWVVFDRSPAMLVHYNHWRDVKNPRVVGIGRAKVSKGFEGIQEAAENAVKDGVRSHFRKILRNKPKRIVGRVLVNKTPSIQIKSGEYKIQLDFFLEIDRIIEYSQF